MPFPYNGVSLMLSVSLEKAGEEDVVDILFSREDSRRVARLFLGWLRDRRGRCSKPEMNKFSHISASDRVCSAGPISTRRYCKGSWTAT